MSGADSEQFEQTVVVVSQSPRRVAPGPLMRRTEAILRRSLDAEDANYWRACCEIAEARDLITGGIGLKAAGFEPHTPSHDSREDFEGRQRELVRVYSQWHDASGVSPEAVNAFLTTVAVAFEGWPTSDIDRDRKRRHGTARKQLSKGLALWCRLRGWK